MDNNKILKESREVRDYVIKIRRLIHQYPEEGMKEFKTSKLIWDELYSMGIFDRKKFANTGIVALISGEKEDNGKVIALRADMDGLSIIEENDVSYASRVPGMMHACGHDAHVAMLLGAAKIINKNKASFSGKVKLLFQPAEEGPGGAKPLIEEGALENPKVDAVVGFHVSSGEETGKVSLKPGNVNAAQDDFVLTVKGKGGHAGSPHKAVDAIVLAAQVVNNLQTVISRKKAPSKLAVITIGTINGGYRRNIIADKVEMRGTIRYFDDELKYELRKWMEEVVEGVTRCVGGDYEIEYQDGYPSTKNDSNLFSEVCNYLKDILGEESVLLYDEPSMGAEDFSYYGRVAPAVFMKLGTAGKNGEFAIPHHSTKFNIDEEALFYGVASFVKISLEYLAKE